MPANTGTPPPDWTPPEQALWHAYRTGRTLDLRTGDPTRDDPATAAHWPPARRIRATTIGRLLLGGPEPEPGHTARLTLRGARITGNLDLTASRIDIPVSIKDTAFDETLVLDHTQLPSLDLDGCTLPALEAEGIRADSWFGLRNARIAGELWLFNARIGGEADLRGTTVGATATLGSIVVDGTLRLSDGFTVTGETRLRNARITGDLFLHHARLDNPGHTALAASGIVVEGGLLAHGLHVYGEANFIGARIATALTFVDVHFDHPDAWALLLIEATCTMLTLRPAPGSTGRISLRDAHTARFVDDVLGWPDHLTVELDGFTYQRLTHRSDDHARPTAEQRLAWLDRQHGADFGTGPRPFAPAPYEQLAAAMRADGREADARHVLRAKERLRHRALGRAAGTWGALQDAAVGFGYLPARALTWIAVLLAGGTGYFRWAGAPAPVKAGEAPTWDPFLYTLDLLLPVIDLGHETARDPTGADKAVALVLIVAGWVLVTTVIAGVGRTLKR
ncbi:hypothetical protein ACPA54_04260 [Uniformispora flossi]|uniref:hypothetical protein n=1 Tax=Uniformispora flossi TaxID=3390723 RepID=UPI003C2FDF5B